MTERLPVSYQPYNTPRGPRVSRRWLLVKAPRDVALGSVSPTPGLTTLIDGVSAIARNPQLVSKTWDQAKKHWEIFRNTPQVLAPSVNIGIAQRLAEKTHYLDVCSEAGVAAASIEGKADLMVDTLKRLLVEEPDQGYFLADVYAALGDFKNFDKLVKAPEVATYDTDLWADTVLAGTKEKYKKWTDAQANIDYAVRLLSRSHDPNSVVPHLRAAEAVFDMTRDADSVYIREVKRKLENPELGKADVHKRNQEAAYSLLLRTDVNAAEALLPDLEAKGVFGWIKPASYHHWRRDLAEAFIHAGNTAKATKVIADGMATVDDYLRKHKLDKVPRWLLSDVTRYRAMEQVIAYRNNGFADFTSITNDILERNFEHATTTHRMKPLLEWVLNTGGSGSAFIAKVHAKIHQPIKGTLESTWDDPEPNNRYRDPDDYQTASALPDLIEMRLQIGDVRNAHRDYAELKATNRRWDGAFDEEEAKCLVAIAKTEHELLRGDYVADLR